MNPAVQNDIRQLCLKSINLVNNEFICTENTQELFTRVEDILPLHTEEFKVEYVQGTVEKFKTYVKCNLNCNTEIDTFIGRYNTKNNETLRVSRTKNPSDKSPYKLVKYYRCHHNTRYEGTMNPSEVFAEIPFKRIKNTNCEFSLVVNMLKCPSEFTALLYIEWNHNHSVKALQSLGFKDIPGTVVEQIKSLFENGLLPGAAHRELMKQVRSECINEEQYHVRIADRSQVPRKSDFNNLYKEYNRKKFGTENLSQMFLTLNKRIEELKKQSSNYILHFQEFIAEADQPFILIIVTPLMRRVHQMVSSLNLSNS